MDCRKVVRNVRDIPQIPVLEIKNERLLEQDYKLCLKTNETTEGKKRNGYRQQVFSYC